MRSLLTLIALTWTISACNTNENRNGLQVERGPTVDTAAVNERGTNLREDSIQTKFVQGPAGSIFVNEDGEGGTPVIFLHAFGGSSDQFKSQMDHLKGSRRVIAFDFRGQGQSAIHASDSLTPPALAGDLNAVIESLGIRQAVLVGHSQGAAAAISYAASHPEKVAGLVLAGAPGRTPRTVADPVVLSLQSDDYDKVMEQYINQLLKGAQPSTRSEVLRGISRLSKQNTIALVKGMFEYDPTPDLKKFRGPILMIYSPADNQQNALYKQAAGTKTKQITGASHWMQMDKPDEFNQALDQFLVGIKGSS